MANSYNSNPIKIDSNLASGWRSVQTLNTKQWGIQVTKVVWNNPGASASFSIVDPTDSTVLLQGNTPASYVGPDPEWDFVDSAKWRDFKVTVSAGVLLIYYKS